jgi:hypothetical protein
MLYQTERDDKKFTNLAEQNIALSAMQAVGLSAKGNFRKSKCGRVSKLVGWGVL